MFLAGYLESDAKLIENVVSVMEAARLGTCPSREPDARPVRLGPVAFRGPARAEDPSGPRS